MRTYVYIWSIWVYFYRWSNSITLFGTWICNFNKVQIRYVNTALNLQVSCALFFSLKIEQKVMDWDAEMRVQLWFLLVLWTARHPFWISSAPILQRALGRVRAVEWVSSRYEAITNAQPNTKRQALWSSKDEDTKAIYKTAVLYKFKL